MIADILISWYRLASRWPVLSPCPDHRHGGRGECLSVPASTCLS